MAETKPDITIGDDWVSLNTLSEVPVGSPFLIQNKTTNWIILFEQSTQPSSSSTDGVYLTDLYQSEGSKLIVADSLEIWAKAAVAGRPCKLSIQPA